MNKQQIQNYAVVKLFDVLRELGKIKGRTQFSRFFCARNSDYFSMILRSAGRQVSIGCLHRLIKRLDYEIGGEKNNQARKKLTECMVSLQAEITTRLDQISNAIKLPHPLM
jgi:hypothetical protein